MGKLHDTGINDWLRLVNLVLSVSELLMIALFAVSTVVPGQVPASMVQSLMKLGIDIPEMMLLADAICIGLVR